MKGQVSFLRSVFLPHPVYRGEEFFLTCRPLLWPDLKGLPDPLFCFNTTSPVMLNEVGVKDGLSTCCLSYLVRVQQGTRAEGNERDYQMTTISRHDQVSEND